MNVMETIQKRHSYRGRYKTDPIGAFLGFILSAGIVVLLYLLNDKIMTPEDLEKRTGLNTLATLPLERK